MSEKSFQKRLEVAQSAGNLSTADLAIWFNRPYHTVRGWIHGRPDQGRKQGYEPWGPYREEAYARLVALEKFVKKNRAPAVSPAKRRAWFRTHARHHRHAGLSKPHSAA